MHYPLPPTKKKKVFNVRISLMEGKNFSTSSKKEKKEKKKERNKLKVIP